MLGGGSARGRRKFGFGRSCGGSLEESCWGQRCRGEPFFRIALAKSRKLTSLQIQIKSIAFAALAQFSAQIHPTLPPLQTNSTFARQKALRVGGSIGDEEDLIEGTDEFAPKLIVLREAGDEEEMVVDEEEEEVVEVVKESKGFPSSSGFASSGFPLPIAPVVVPTVAAPISEDVFIPTPIAASSFIVAPVRPVTKAAPQKTAVKQVVVEEEEDDSDDDMPEIDMASDEE